MEDEKAFHNNTTWEKIYYNLKHAKEKTCMDKNSNHSCRSTKGKSKKKNYGKNNQLRDSWLLPNISNKNYVKK